MDHTADHFYATPTLIRAARGSYARSIRAHVQDLGVDDLPRNAAFILAGIDRPGGPRPDLPGDLGVTKQAVSQIIDVLVNRGYVERGADTEDRRRIALSLTERGRQVLEAVAQGVEAVDEQLAERIPPEHIEHMRAGLQALAEIKTADHAAGTGRPRRDRRWRQFSPIFPVRDLDAALAHYQDLGFTTLAYEGGGYGFANRDGIGLHLAHQPTHHRAHNEVATYLYVRDADALYEEWSRPGIGGRTVPVKPTPYGLREGAHIDPDHNLIRFGSPVDED
jgi:DNA-binding MarR family transcriptional regulator